MCVCVCVCVCTCTCVYVCVCACTTNFSDQYIVIMLILVLVQVSVAVLIYIKRNDSASLLETVWRTLDNGGRVAIENALTCCGFNTVNDTIGTKFFR